jgi:hypothetical protein
MIHVTILGKRWRLRFTKLARGTDGECDAPTDPDKEIRIAQGLGEKTQLETLIHEALHAADWSKDEAWVEQVGCDIARLLWRLGYRRKTNADVDDDAT